MNWPHYCELLTISTPDKRSLYASDRGDGLPRWHGVKCRAVSAKGESSSAYESQSKTIPCEDNGIIFSITTFNGDNESKPFVKCLGHTWLSVDNQSGHSVYIKDYEIKNDEMITFSVWAVSDLPGLLFNLEADYISAYGRYVGRKTLSANIEESQLKIIEAYIDQRDRWTLSKNCSYWSIHLWNEVVDEAFKLKTQTLFYTPKRLEKSFCEFDCVEVDKDFSRAGCIFCYRDGVRTELRLCS